MPLTAPRRQSQRDSLRPVATDLLRLAAALSVVLGTLGWGFIGFALFMLVLGGSMIPRALGTPAPLDLSYCATILVGAWAAMLDWYLAVSWLDVVVHAALTGLVGAIGYAALERLGLFGEGMTRLGVVVVSSTLATTLALLWEMGGSGTPSSTTASRWVRGHAGRSRHRGGRGGRRRGPARPE